MGRKKNTLTIKADDIEKAVDILNNATKKGYRIKEASIHDDFCHYKFLITDGVGKGRTMDSKNQSNIISHDLRESFSKLTVHLAFIDDIFKANGIEIDDIDKFHNHELTGLYRVTGFKVKGCEDSEEIVLFGNKYVSIGGGGIDIETPRIPLDNYSSYKWYNELKTSFEEARLQVELYHEGDYELVEAEEVEPKSNAKQLTIGDAINDNTEDDDFDNPM